VKTKGNYFVVSQCDAIVYPEKKMSVQRFRTDLSTGTEYPKFSKNVFKFENLSLGDRIVIKFGLFRARDNVDVT
jgi:hypothetical protein